MNFLEGKRELAGTIRRCLSNNHLRDKTSGAESPNLSNPPSVCLPASSPLPAPEIPETVPTQTPRRGTANTKSPKSLSSRAKKVEVVKKSKEPEQYTLDPEPKHEYGTRRKRSKKQFDEFVMSDTSKRKKRGSIHEENDDDVGENEMEYSQQSNTALPIVYVSDIRSSPECDEVIDMTSLPNQRRRLAASRIFIDMTPTLTGRQPTISESQIEINKKRTPLPVSKDENGEIYNTTLSSVSHSKLTRVGDEFQAVIPDLQPQPAITQSLDHDFLCALPDDLNNQWQRAARKKEEIFLASSSSHVIVAVIPCSNSRRIRRSPAPPACILPIKSIRAELLSNQYTSPPECVMSMDLRKTLFPRLCVTLRRLVLIESQFSVVERPVLYFRPEGSDELIESPIWGCDYLQADENSDSETEWSDVHCRGKDIYTMMSNRYQDDQSIFLEVTDGTQVRSISSQDTNNYVFRIGLSLLRYVPQLVRLIQKNSFSKMIIVIFKLF